MQIAIIFNKQLQTISSIGLKWCFKRQYQRNDTFYLRLVIILFHYQLPVYTKIST
ncbi:hypothetical protein yfred0001_1000 [Yersinia frederiksenii ATCC 33641]|nr:hypothetical protein yfred0001_1000 [Yersinia frederiksenii ATCC 33641]